MRRYRAFARRKVIGWGKVTHFSSYKVTPSHRGRYDEKEPYSPPPVVTSYFDPATGEPRNSRAEPKPRPKKKQEMKTLRQQWREASDRNKKPVLVDGELQESVTEAARLIGATCSTLSRILRNGGREYGGHTVAYAVKEETECQ